MGNPNQFLGLSPSELAHERDQAQGDPHLAALWEAALQTAESRQYLGNLIERLIAAVEKVEKAVQQ